MKHPSSIIRTIPLVIVVLSSIVLTFSLDSVVHATVSPRDATVGPVALSGTMTDYYADGTAVSREQMGTLRARPAGTSSHPLSKNETRVLSLDELAILPETEPGWILDDAAHTYTPSYTFPTTHDVLHFPFQASDDK